MPRPPAIHHCTSLPLHFFGRHTELALLDDALAGGDPSLVAMSGPGGQGKTAIAQHWLSSLPSTFIDRQNEKARLLPSSPEWGRGSIGLNKPIDGVFLWSFYRGKNSDLCLRHLLAYAEAMDHLPEVSASYCVDRLIPLLRRERWALVFDGTEVVQHDQGAWFGRFVHPELGRLLEELASAPMPGVVVLTSRFPLPTLASRRHARILSLSTLDVESAVALLQSLGVHGQNSELTPLAREAGLHAKAVELLGTLLAHFHGGDSAGVRQLPELERGQATEEEYAVSRILAGFRANLPLETQDVLALALAFRQPPVEARFLEYLASDAVLALLHDVCRRTYEPFPVRPPHWLGEQVNLLVCLGLLERVGSTIQEADVVLDAHPLVRTGFEGVLGKSAQHTARARAGFLRGRPDRQPPASLSAAREEVELFHAYCEAGLWSEADSTMVGLDNPKHRFLAPAFERDLLLHFFPGGDWRQRPLWPGFGRWRSLAICFEMLGQFEDALDAYRPEDAALRGDALLALGRLQPFLTVPHVQEPWNNLWQAYRAHALALLGRTTEAASLVRTLIPIDIYEWVHVFESLLRLQQLPLLDLDSILYRAPGAEEHRWSRLARARLRLDYLRVTSKGAELGKAYRELMEEYDRGGLPLERALVRLSLGRWLHDHEQREEALASARSALELSEIYRLKVCEIDALELLAALGAPAEPAAATTDKRRALAYAGPGRP